MDAHTHIRFAPTASSFLRSRWYISAKHIILAFSLAYSFHRLQVALLGQKSVQQSTNVVLFYSTGGAPTNHPGN